MPALPPERTAADVAEAQDALADLYARMGWVRDRPPLDAAASPEALEDYARRRRAVVAEQRAAEPEPVSTVCDLGDHAACPGCGCGCHR
jgi:hypothetical protein